MRPLRLSSRGLRIGGLLIAALALGIALAPLPVGGERAAQILAEQTLDRAGVAAVASPDSIRLTLLPFPKISATEIRFVDGDGRALGRAGGLDAYLRPLDLIAGRVGFGGYALRAPVFDAATAETRNAWRRIGGKLAESAGLESPPADLAVTAGVVLAGDAQATGVEAAIAWAGGAQPLSIWARGRWKGEEAEFRLSEIRPDAIAGVSLAASPARLHARGPFGSIDARGEFSGGLAPRLDGDFAIAVASAERLSRWLGVAAPLTGVVDSYSIEARGVATLRGFSTPAATIALPGGKLEGTLAMRLDGPRTQISGTLASQSLDFGMLSRSLDDLRAPGGGWSADGFEAAPLRRTDLDLRLSAATLLLMGARLEDAAASVMLNAGKLEFVLGRAQAYDGTLRGRATVVAGEDDRIEARLQAGFENIDLGAAAQEFAGRRFMSGRGQGQIQLEGSGRSPAEIARQLSGRIAAQAKEGELGGVNLIDAARRAERLQPGAIEFGRGRTPFASVDFSAILAQGYAIIQDAQLAASGFSLRAAGGASLSDLALQIEGRARAVGLPIDGLPFSLRGPLLRPELRWDFGAAARRS